MTERSAPPTRQERLVLLALALLGRANISTLTLTAGVLGARETEARAYSTTSLKRTLEPFIAAGWVLGDGNGYECNFGLATRVLRTFPSAELTTLGNSYLASQRHASYSYAYSAPWPTELEVQIKLGLAGAGFEWERSLDLLLQLTSPFHVTHRVLREPLMGAFELAWFQGFSPAQQLRLARQLLEWCELTTHELGLFEQQNPVTLYRLVAKSTIEERIVALHRTKRDLADSLLAESDQAAALSSVELRALLNAE